MMYWRWERESPGDFYAKEIGSGAKISKFEVSGQLCNNGLDRGNRATCKSDIIDKDRDYDLDITLGVDID